MPNDNTPILVGSGLTVQKEKDASKAKSPLVLLAEAAKNAISDAALNKVQIDTVAGIRFVTDSPEGRNLPFGKYNNIGLSVARHLDIEPAQALIAATGGNSPQMMINELAERIANGDVGTAMLVGGEGLGSIMAALGQGLTTAKAPVGTMMLMARARKSALKKTAVRRSSGVTCSIIRSIIIRYLKTRCAIILAAICRPICKSWVS